MNEKIKLHNMENGDILPVLHIGHESVVLQKMKEHYGVLQNAEVMLYHTIECQHSTIEHYGVPAGHYKDRDPCYGTTAL